MIHRAKRNPIPGPGSYNTDRAIEITQRKAIENVPQLKAKKIAFVDSHANLFKDNPSPSQYDNLDKLPASLSTSPSRKRL